MLHFDGARGLWKISHETGHYYASSEELHLLQLTVKNVLNLLPDPPQDHRIRYAIQELQDLGLVTMAGQRPTTLGAACLKLPVDVPLARLVVLGWTLDLAVHGAILASALSLNVCDLMSTPHNHMTELGDWDLDLLRYGVNARLELDQDRLSEPLIVHALCCEWLQGRDCQVGRIPEHFWKTLQWHLNPRLWSQFTSKLVELLTSMRSLCCTDCKSH